MNRKEIEAFRRQIRNLVGRYENALGEIERDYSRRKKIRLENVRGMGKDLALEAHVRAYLLDPILIALGWDITVPDTLVIEDSVESTYGGGYRRRLDYHGRDNAHGRSLLVVEAKRSSFTLPDPCSNSLTDLFAHALNGIHRPNTDFAWPTAEWHRTLESAVDYVKRVFRTNGHVPVRFAISNGEWFVVISDLQRSMLDGNVLNDSVHVFKNCEDVGYRAEEFCSLLGYRRLTGCIPVQHPSALANFVPKGEVATCARLVDVSYVRHGERQPLISVSVGVWVQVPRGGWVLFRKEYPRQFLMVRDESSELMEDLSQVKARADELLHELRTHRQLQFVSSDELEALLESHLPAFDLSGRSSILVREIARDIYRVITSDQYVYLTEDRSYDDCCFHNWGDCKNDGSAVGAGPVVSPSTDPRCYFPSGSPYHCAHAAIQTRRNQVCLLLPVEEHLCCRRCVYLKRCWPEPDTMPCRSKMG